MDSVHILAPATIGLLLSLFSFLDENLIASKIQKFFEGGTCEVVERHPEAIAVIECLVLGSVSFVTFMANSLLFIINCFVAFLIFPPTMNITVIIIGVLASVALIYQVLWLLVSFDLYEISSHVCLTVPFSHRPITISLILRLEGILMNALMFFYFIWGLSNSLPHLQALPNIPSAPL